MVESRQSYAEAGDIPSPEAGIAVGTSATTVIGDTHLRRMQSAINPAVFSHPDFLRMFFRCVLTAWDEMQSLSAMADVLKPPTIKRMISVSRLVKGD